MLLIKRFSDVFLRVMLDEVFIQQPSPHSASTVIQCDPERRIFAVAVHHHFTGKQ